jgi:hypothetical protein
VPSDKHDNEEHTYPDAEEKKVATVAIRLPILILVALLLMLAMGVLAVKMHGG